MLTRQDYASCRFMSSCVTAVPATFPSDTLAQVKNKMAKPDFLKNNRGIDDGQDLAEDYMSELYDRIIQDEIKMKVQLVLLHHPGWHPWHWPAFYTVTERECG